METGEDGMRGRETGTALASPLGPPGASTLGERTWESQGPWQSWLDMQAPLHGPPSSLAAQAFRGRPAPGPAELLGFMTA